MAPASTLASVRGTTPFHRDGVLYPNEMQVALAAFDAAVASLHEIPDCDLADARDRLAEYISNHALLGEVDVDRLRSGALNFLKTGGMRAVGTAWGRTAASGLSV